MKISDINLMFLLICIQFPVNGQLNLGTARSEINFREEPGLNFGTTHTTNHSNLPVILPSEPQNEFTEAFDIETSSHGFIY